MTVVVVMATGSALPLAVIFATKGGMGDVGKFAAAHAFTSAGVSARVIALAPHAENPDLEVDVDVTDEAVRTELKSTFGSITPVCIDMDAKTAQSQLDTALKDVSGVVACIGSRQPSYSRWCERGAGMVEKAMRKGGVKRLVVLSSFGIGGDFTGLSMIKIGWLLMLRTTYRSVRKDLMGMEAVAEGSGLDYLIVRTMGLTPSEEPKGAWKLLTGPGQGRLRLGIAKKDVAAFMVKEIVEPSLHRTAVTIGQEK